MSLWLQIGRVHTPGQRPVTAVGRKPSAVQDHKPDLVDLHEATHCRGGWQTPGCVKSGRRRLIRSWLLWQLVLPMEGIHGELAVQKVRRRLQASNISRNEVPNLDLHGALMLCHMMDEALQRLELTALGQRGSCLRFLRRPLQDLGELLLRSRKSWSFAFAGMTGRQLHHLHVEVVPGGESRHGLSEKLRPLGLLRCKLPLLRLRELHGLFHEVLRRDPDLANFHQGSLCPLSWPDSFMDFALLATLSHDDLEWNVGTVTIVVVVDLHHERSHLVQRDVLGWVLLNL
mmetsp:Transcript_89744/g.214497  ORF Transcript_89744/g.214497 Transcript_89744/m.214497 type:complete len:287 (-) Transcript_89744:99-959(-)